jgi:crotonobetainyl-CoA:carnitine CoA-transferase CaiB-like acyl-CoA transferase
MVQDIEHPIEGTFKALGFPVKLSDTPQEVRHHPPLLDEHGDELRQELREKGLLPAAREEELAAR